MRGIMNGLTGPLQPWRRDATRSIILNLASEQVEQCFLTEIRFEVFNEDAKEGGDSAGVAARRPTGLELTLWKHLFGYPQSKN
jgi:hypothetical protein